MKTWDEITRELNRLQGISTAISTHVRQKGPDEESEQAFAKVAELTQQLRAVLETEIYGIKNRHVNRQNTINTMAGELGRITRK